MRDLKTGECDQVMKVFKGEFDPCTPLVEGLREAMIGMHEDPDRVLRICDRLLALDPKMEAAAFDKGVALLVKQEPGAALEAFNLALVIAPGDILNLVHRAACHAKLGEDEKMLRDLQAPGLHPQQLQQALLMVPALAQSIHHALLRLAKSSGNQKTARHILSQCFGPWVRFRLFLARRRNKRG